jgi:hypothetical protein
MTVPPRPSRFGRNLRPLRVIGGDAQTVGVSEQSIAHALNKIALLIKFRKHGLGALKEEYVPLRIHRDGRSRECRSASWIHLGNEKSKGFQRNFIPFG